eukprot:TRINITY_DN9006_c0_g1_i2.p1 TRINITY_DN9006_c0_g1~~TRINITY_DN9006_c0_g1_i2.p1  ORF type:complete len:173 (+),score=30.19 TRINITY_DN9006_c0_g1_i2:710-1228(+)
MEQILAILCFRGDSKAKKFVSANSEQFLAAKVAPGPVRRPVSRSEILRYQAKQAPNLSEDDNQKDREILASFELPETEKITARFNCLNYLLLRGTLFLTKTHLCFDTQLFSGSSKIVLEYSEIESIAKTESMFLSGLEIFMNDGRRISFPGCLGARDTGRDALFQILEQLIQ